MDPITKLQNAQLTSSEVFEIINNLIFKLNRLLNSKFLGDKLEIAIKNLSDIERKKFEDDCVNVYSRTLEYLEKYDLSVLKHLSVLNIKKKIPSYKELCELAIFLKLDINKNVLFDEIGLVELALKELKDKTMSTLNQWLYVFKMLPDLTEITKIVSKAFSIPTGQASIERIFSLMNTYWSDNRNRCTLDLIKAELAIKTNFTMTCFEFNEFLNKNVNKEQTKVLIAATRSQEKYVFKK